MKTKILSLSSALMASMCCLGPLIIAILGLGSLGLGSLIVKYHWHLILLAVVLLSLSWRSYFKEKKVCATKQCEFKGKGFNLVVLVLASMVVSYYAGTSIYYYFQ